MAWRFALLYIFLPDHQREQVVISFRSVSIISAVDLVFVCVVSLDLLTNSSGMIFMAHHLHHWRLQLLQAVRSDPQEVLKQSLSSPFPHKSLFLKSQRAEMMIPLHNDPRLHGVLILRKMFC